jgi:hypothetical protein
MGVPELVLNSMWPGSVGARSYRNWLSSPNFFSRRAKEKPPCGGLTLDLLKMSVSPGSLSDGTRRRDPHSQSTRPATLRPNQNAETMAATSATSWPEPVAHDLVRACDRYDGEENPRTCWTQRYILLTPSATFSRLRNSTSNKKIPFSNRVKGRPGRIDRAAEMSSI